ncbi:MAG: protein translocase subunit SecF [Candidatus Wildermuthbacteria bacterium]|nr:protein translocase subunit SecF [Candidatus Wildermuthbacteria bacterium]
MRMTFAKIQTALLVFFLVSAAAAAFSVGFFGLRFGIEFTGGSILEVRYAGERPAVSQVRDLAQNVDMGTLSIQPVGERGMIFKTRDLSEEEHAGLVSSLGQVEELRFESVGPAIGRELQNKALILTILAVLVVAAYIAFAFRRTAGGIFPWHWSGAALVSSLCYVLIPLGVFAALGFFTGVEITIPVLVALLTVVGYAINDTVVVFDRIRENLAKRSGFDFQDITRRSLKETWFRSFSTSFTVLLVLAALYAFGGETLRGFSLMLILGVVTGTFASLFVGPALLVRWRNKAGD